MGSPSRVALRSLAECYYGSSVRALSSSPTAVAQLLRSTTRPRRLPLRDSSITRLGFALLSYSIMKSKQVQEMWVFGYGSLIWKADFPYERKVVGYIKGYVRRFYQKSPDHRGVPSRPGRVVMLLPSNNPDDEVWGCAYKIADENVESVTTHLDFRERGYDKVDVLFHPLNNSQTNEEPFHLFIYNGHETNPNFAGHEDIDTIAGHIAECAGASGHNTEYLYNLATAMRSIAPKVYDEHLFELEDAVKRIELLKKKKNLDFDRNNHNHNHNIAVN